MFPRWTRLGVACLTLALIVGSADSAKAWWGWYPYGWWYSPYWGCGGWYLGVRPGPIRRLLFGPYRWYWVPGACCYVDCCWVVPCDPCEPTPPPPKKPTDQGQALPRPAQPSGIPNFDGAPGGVSAPAGGDLPLPAPTGVQGGQAPPDRVHAVGQASLVGLSSTSAEIWVEVPADATVRVNGYLTKSVGTARRFVSVGLAPGHTYRYDIEVELERKGQVLRHTETVRLTAGQRVELLLNVAPTEDRLLAVVQ